MVTAASVELQAESVRPGRHQPLFGLPEVTVEST
jgi:hypothetical protein